MPLVGDGQLCLTVGCRVQNTALTTDQRFVCERPGDLISNIPSDSIRIDGLDDERLAVAAGGEADIGGGDPEFNEIGGPRGGGNKSAEDRKQNRPS